MKHQLSASEKLALAQITNMIGEKNSPLIWAVINGYVQYVELLYKAGADLNETDKTMQTPLMRSVLCNQTDVTRQLISYGADHTKKDHKGKTAADYAMDHAGIKDIMLLLMLEATLDKSMLMVAICAGNQRGVKLLLQSGVNIEFRDKKGRTALHLAVASNDDDITKILLDYGADIEAQDLNLRTPLIMAVARNSPAIVKTLCEYNVNLDTLDNEQATAMSWAKNFGHVDIMDILDSHEFYTKESILTDQFDDDLIFEFEPDVIEEDHLKDLSLLTVSSTDNSFETTTTNTSMDSDRNMYWQSLVKKSLAKDGWEHNF